jgi:hypothetical protein
MPQDIKIWEINGQTDLREIPKSKLDLEERLEDWIKQDISILSEDYLVIGRQVPTDFNTYIDLLCLDNNGDLVIVELKKDKTPRDVVAQALDYASWVNDLSHDSIIAIASKTLENGKSLEKEFKDKFGSELPEVLNTNHSMLIVASTIDSSTERIIQYLSEKYGVGINVIQFQYHRHSDGTEYLSRIFLLRPEIVDSNTQRKSTSKRKPNLTSEQLQEIANTNGVGEIYAYLYNELYKVSNGIQPTQSSIGFRGKDVVNGAKMGVFFNLIPTQSSRETGLKFQIYLSRTAKFFDISEKSIEAILPKDLHEWHYSDVMLPEWSGYEGFFKTMSEAESFMRIVQ